MKKAQIGFIGAGNFITAHHLLTARDSNVMAIRAIADIDKKRLEKHSSAMSIGYTTEDYQKVLSDPEIDIVIIGTKQDLHANLIKESLDAGKWVFCEKPMAETEDDTLMVLQAERDNPGKLAIGFNRRFAPAYMDVKKIFRSIKRPWYINYRLMYPNGDKRKKESFYAFHERILYEGCHILDLVCWFLEDCPTRIFMTGDRYLNNCCILEFGDGSQVSFMCGSMGTPCLWKEYMEIFGVDSAITVSDLVDMRVRGFEGKFDRLYTPYLGEHEKEIKKYGFDFYEGYKVEQHIKNFPEWENAEHVKRPTLVRFDAKKYKHENPDLWGFVPDKGWVKSLEHFAQSFLDNKIPENADGKAGALNTKLALMLLKSLETGKAINFSKERWFK